jgi:hypothetical protein
MSDAIEKPRLDVPMIDRIKALPRDRRGYPVPWFVAYVDGEPYFPALDVNKFKLAIRQKRCWICGQTLGRWLTFCVGPMCTLNRISAEPPCHDDCAQYAVKVCPFMLRPEMKRVPETKHPDKFVISAQHDLRNPGIMAIYHARTYRPVMHDVPLIEMGPPVGGVSWWTRGHAATRQEVEEALREGGERLRAGAIRLDGGTPEALAEVERLIKRGADLLPSK